MNIPGQSSLPTCPVIPFKEICCGGNLIVIVHGQETVVAEPEIDLPTGEYQPEYLGE